jgi:uncharacterized surface protein with fasciclin (FAS1) repeats
VAKISEVVSSTAGLKTLSEALTVSGIDKTLLGAGPFTFFAPTEEAFSELGVDELVALAADRDDLAATLRTHIVAGRYRMNDLVGMYDLESIDGTGLYVSVGEDHEAYVEEARIVQGDIEAENGVVHLIDLVILPLPDQSPGTTAIQLADEAQPEMTGRHVFDQDAEDEADAMAV